MSRSRGHVGGGSEPAMDVLKDWMLEIREGNNDGALIDDVKFMEDNAQPSPLELDSIRGSECDILQDITNEDLVYVEATTHLDMSFYRDSSSLLQSSSRSVI